MWISWVESANFNCIPSQEVLFMKLCEITHGLLLWSHHRTDVATDNLFLTPVFIFEQCKEICLFHDIISKHGDNFCVYILIVNLQVLQMRLLNFLRFLFCCTTVCPLAFQFCCQALCHIDILRLKFVAIEQYIEIFNKLLLLKSE